MTDILILLLANKSLRKYQYDKVIQSFLSYVEALSIAGFYSVL